MSQWFFTKQSPFVDCVRSYDGCNVNKNGRAIAEPCLWIRDATKVTG